MNGLDLSTIHLDHGAHDSPDDGHCVMEVVSMFAKQPFSDQPQCVCPTLRSLFISWNDSLPDDERQQLLRYVPLLPGTAQGNKLALERSALAMDWLWRDFTPAWLRLAKLDDHARKMAESSWRDESAVEVGNAAGAGRRRAGADVE